MTVAVAFVYITKSYSLWSHDVGVVLGAPVTYTYAVGIPQHTIFSACNFIDIRP